MSSNTTKKATTLLCIGILAIAGFSAGFANIRVASASTSAGAGASTAPTARAHQPHDAPTRQKLASSNPSNGLGLLQYNGGPTMKSSSVAYLIFWEPPTLQDGTATYVSPTYNSLIQQYFTDANGAGLYNNNTQYYDTTGHIMNTSSIGGVWVDNSPYPASGCTDSYTPHGCMQVSQLKTEISNALTVNGWSGGVNHMFFIFTSWGEGSCHGDCSFSNFCAFHDVFTSNSQSVVFANMPYMGTDLPNCGVTTSPNNDFDADSTINYMSHEQMEMVTDPLLNAWYDSNNNEIGDKCGFKFGSVNLDNNTANEEWNGHFYIVQEEFSNAIDGCVQTRALSGTVYASSDDTNLYALSASNSSLSWSTQIDNSGYSSPTVANGVVYTGSTNNSVYAYNVISQSLLWQFTTVGPVYSSPTVSKGAVYVGSNDGYLYSINATTGLQNWRFLTGGTITSSPVVYLGVVYVGSSDGNLYAINTKTGLKKWSFPTGGPITASPVIYKSAVYVGSNDGNLYDVNVKTGLRNWSFPTGSPIIHSSVTAAYNTVYIGSSAGVLYAINAATGIQVWSYTTGGEIFASPQVTYGVVYVGSWDDYLYAINSATGALVWRYLTGGQISSSPRVVDGVVYVGSDDHSIYALWTGDAILIWQYQTQNSVEATLAVVLTSF